MEEARWESRSTGYTHDVVDEPTEIFDDLYLGLRAGGAMRKKRRGEPLTMEEEEALGRWESLSGAQGGDGRRLRGRHVQHRLHPRRPGLRPLAQGLSPSPGRKTAGKPAGLPKPQTMPGERDEHVCLEMRRHGIVLARPLARSGGVVIAGIFILILPWAAAAVVGAALIAVAAAFTLRAVWQWERTRIVVTTEKLYVVNGTLRRRTKTVKLRAVDAVELDQSLLGQLIGYGTLVVGPLTVGHVAEPRRSASSSKSSRPDGPQNRFPLPDEEASRHGRSVRPSDLNGELIMRKILVMVTVLASSLALTGLGLGSATTKLAATQLTATLNNAQEVPKPDADGGSGRFTGTLTGRSLKWKLTFRGLTGPQQQLTSTSASEAWPGRLRFRFAGHACLECTARRESRRTWPSAQGSRRLCQRSHGEEP